MIATIRKIREEVSADPNWGTALISKTPWLLRVNDLGDSGVVIKVVGETQPMRQWDLVEELRRGIKNAFDERGIVIPWNYMKVYMGDDISCLCMLSTMTCNRGR